MKRKWTLITAMTLAVVMVISFPLIGCGSEKDVTTLDVSLEGDPPDLDLSCYTATLTLWATSPINGFLVDYDQELNIVPGIAESYNFPDEKTFKFTLREGVFFHNGREVTADDVKFSVDRILDPATGSPMRIKFEAVNSVEVIDKYNGIFHLKYSYAPLLDKLTRLPIVAKETVSTLKTAPIGCGPFKFKEWKKDQRIELVKFDKYWQKGYPKVDRIVFHPLSEYNSARSAFLAKDLDILLWTKNTDVPSMEKIKDVKVVGQLNLGFYYVMANFNKPPFDNLKVRQAIKYALKRKPMLDSALGGYGDTACIPIDKKSVYYDASFEYKEDIEKAKQLLKEAGFPDGFESEIIAPQTPVEGPLGEIVQSQLKDIGINLKLTKLEVPTYIDMVWARKDFFLMVCGDTAAGDPDQLLYGYFKTDGPNNLGSYSNSKVDELLLKGRSTYDIAQRKSAYTEAIKIIQDEVPIIYLVQEMRFATVQNYVKDFVYKPDLTYDFTKVTK